MKSQISPVVAIIIVVVVLAGLGFFFYKQSEGKSFSKSEASGKMGSGIDLSKLQQSAPPEQPK